MRYEQLKTCLQKDHEKRNIYFPISVRFPSVEQGVYYTYERTPCKGSLSTGNRSKLPQHLLILVFPGTFVKN